MKTINNFKKYGSAAIFAAVIMTGCSKDDDPVTPVAVTPVIAAPAVENELEVITDVKLIFTNVSNANDIVEARAQDPDGAGVQELVILDEINLDTSKTYTLTYEIFNNLESPGENIGNEISEEDEEHQLFYGFSNNVFTNPTGNGNIDNGTDPLSYNDMDGNGNPIGLSTTWTTSASQLSGGSFTVRLQHQPDIKTATSGATDGDTDFELQFVLTIQ
jgi:hypothetical protein